MIEGYIIEIDRYFRNDIGRTCFTIDTVYTNLNEAIERSRMIYNEYCKAYNELVRPFDLCHFSDKTGKFNIYELWDHYYADGTIRKVTIKLDNKKTKEDNND